MNPLVIFGCGGHAKSVTDVILFNEPHRKIILVDKNARQDEKILGFSIVNDYIIKDEDVFVAIGDNKLRKEISERYYKNLISIISKRAYLGKNTNIGKGVFIAHNAHIGVLSTIKDFSVINTNASIDHECTIGVAATVAPGAVLCGRVTVGNNSWIGANVAIKENVNIADNIIIGMGAVVIKDVINTGTYVGCPARLIRGASE
jgi:sugar O-acyltransferase (sialic acid O-acetyltransferase NeuD family)